MSVPVPPLRKDSPKWLHAAVWWLDALLTVAFLLAGAALLLKAAVVLPAL